MFLFLLPVGLMACSVNNTETNNDPCSELANKCPLCTDPGLKQTCEAAVASHDAASCQDGLSDRDVQDNCRSHFGSGGSSSGGSSSGGSSSGGNGGSGTAGTGGGTGGGACSKLAALCPECDNATLMATCQATASAGSASACQDQLDNPVIQNGCAGSGGSGGSSGSGGSGSGGSGGGGGSCSDVSGVWDFVAGCGATRCTVTQTGCDLVFDCIDKYTSYTGSISGNTLSFKGTTANVPSTCSATVSGNNMAGSCTGLGATCNFSAQRQ